MSAALALLVVVAAIAATAAITYAITKSSSAPVATSAPTTAAAQRFTPEQQAAAKKHVCQVFDASTAGQQGQGGLQVDGNPNSPLLIRKLTSVVAVQNALTSQTPSDVEIAADDYINASLDLMNAALGNGSVEDINRLTSSSNEATYALADVCGLSH